MKNALKFLCVLLCIASQTGCERDDICLEDITPKLIIRFYNNEIPDEFRSVQNLKVNIEGIEGEYNNGTIGSVTDSIAVPLLVDQNSTKIILTLMGDALNETEDNPDTITLTYNQQDLFVSRSCGFKTVYNDAMATLTQDDNNWIKILKTRTDPVQIIDENIAHVKIYH